MVIDVIELRAVNNFKPIVNMVLRVGDSREHSHKVHTSRHLVFMHTYVTHRNK